jgi:dTDP-4-dehydrorhamnose reductase
VEPTTIRQSVNMDDADRKAKLIAKYKPDIVIGAQCD